MPLKPGRWAVSPAEIDPQYLGLWRDLVFVLKPGEADNDEQDLYAKHVRWRGGGGVVSEPTKWGMGWRADTGGSRSLTTLPLDIDSCSVLVVADWDDNGGAVQNCLVKRSAGAGSRSFYLFHDSAGTITLGTNVAADSSVSTGTVDGPVVVVVTNDGADASAGTKFYFDGVLDSSTSGVTGTDNTDVWVFGQRADNSTADPFDGRLVLGVLWNRILSAAEVNLLQLDPFGFIRPAPIVTEVDAVSGAGAIAEQSDDATGAGAVLVSGAGAIAEQPDDATGAGSVLVSGAGAVAEQPDDASGVGSTAITGSGSITESSDIVAGAGNILISGSGAITEQPDNATGVGTSGGVAALIAAVSVVERPRASVISRRRIKVTDRNRVT